MRQLFNAEIEVSVQLRFSAKDAREAFEKICDVHGHAPEHIEEAGFQYHGVVGDSDTVRTMREEGLGKTHTLVAFCECGRAIINDEKAYAGEDCTLCQGCYDSAELEAGKGE